MLKHKIRDKFTKFTKGTLATKTEFQRVVRFQLDFQLRNGTTQLFPGGFCSNVHNNSLQDQNC